MTMQTVIGADEARVNVTWKGQNGDVGTSVRWGADDEEVIAMATEAIRNGGAVGIDADPAVNLRDFMVQKCEAKDGLPNRYIIRPKAPFGRRNLVA